MSAPISTHTIAPAAVLRGEGAWTQALPRIAALSQIPLLLGRSSQTEPLRGRLFEDLQRAGLLPRSAQLHSDCCEEDLLRLIRGLSDSPARPCDAVIAAGGGKVLDAGKLLASRLNLPCITVPLSASTCAGWTALANLSAGLGAAALSRSSGVRSRPGATGSPSHAGQWHRRCPCQVVRGFGEQCQQ